MREDILKELELWPLWTLRGAAPVADAAHQVAESNRDAVTSAPVNAKPSAKKMLAQLNTPAELAPVVAAEDAPKQATFQLFESANGDCLMVHSSEALNQEALQLRHNMATAMRLNMQAIQQPLAVAQILDNRQPKVVILMGEATAQSLLQVDDKLEDLRGMELIWDDYACVVTYDVKHLLQNTQDKAKAWDDLCLALDILKLA